MRKLIIFSLLLFVYSGFVFGACTETDGGNNIGVAGLIYVTGVGIYADNCITGQLKEFWCITQPMVGEYSFLLQDCPLDTRCYRGACITAECNDNFDNDGDLLLDMGDPGCSSLFDNDETDFVLREPGTGCLLDSQCKYNNCEGGICGGKGAPCAFSVTTRTDGSMSYTPLSKDAGTPSYIAESCESNSCDQIDWQCDGLANNEECSSDFQCESNICDNNVCFQVEELPDIGLDCSNGECRDPYSCGLDNICGGEGADCSDVSQCFHALNCFNNKCISFLVECVYDMDCDSNFVCTDNHCVAIQSGFTVSFPCSFNEDCANGQICQGNICIAETCDPACDDGLSCQNGECISDSLGDSCENDEGCADGLSCSSGECGGQDAACILDTGCVSGVCENNLCTAEEISGGCTTIQDCDTNQYCFDGGCFSNAPTSCDSDSQCVINMVCSIPIGEEVGTCVPKPGDVIEGGDDLLYDCDDLGGVYCPGASCSSDSEDINGIVTVVSQQSGPCCVKNSYSIDGFYSPGECEFSEYNPLSGTVETCTEQPCQDPDGDGEGTKIIDCGDERTEPCVLVPNVARENDSSFFDYWSLFIALGVIIGFYALKRKF